MGGRRATRVTKIKNKKKLKEEWNDFESITGLNLMQQQKIKTKGSNKKKERKKYETKNEK